MDVTGVKAQAQCGSAQTVSFGRRTDSRPRCADCPIAGFCDGKELVALGARVGSRRIRRGETLCRADTEYAALYVVRFGSFKSQMAGSDGRQQVISFPLPGDAIGLDAIAGDRYSTDTIALQDAEVCSFSDPERSVTPEASGYVAAHVRRLMSREIVAKQRCLAILGTMCSNERVAAFLLDLSTRCSARHWSSNSLVLHMTRVDISSFLGLQPETVSRALSQMQARGLLRIAPGRQITLTDTAGLRSMLGAEAPVPDRLPAKSRPSCAVALNG